MSQHSNNTDDVSASAKSSVAMLLAFCIIVSVGFLLAHGKATRTQILTTVSSDVSEKQQYLTIQDHDHVIGDRDARIVVYYYFDLECPWCKKYQTTKGDFEQRFSEKNVAFVYRHFPLLYLHTKALSEAIALECVSQLGDGDSFWKYLDSVYKTTESDDSLDLEVLPKLAEEAGIDRTKYTACLNASVAKKKIQYDIATGILQGVTGTPTYVVYKDGLFAFTSKADLAGLEKAITELILVQ